MADTPTPSARDYRSLAVMTHLTRAIEFFKRTAEHSLPSQRIALAQEFLEVAAAERKKCAEELRAAFGRNCLLTGFSRAGDWLEDNKEQSE